MKDSQDVHITPEHQAIVNNAYKNQLRFYLYALVTLAIIFTGSYFFESSKLESQKHFADIINLSGRQRMLTQNIAAWVLEFQRDIETGKYDPEDLVYIKKSLDDFTKNNSRFFLKVNEDDSLSDLNNEDIQKIYQESEDSISRFVTETKYFLDNANKLEPKKVDQVKNLAKHVDTISHLALIELAPKLDSITYERSKLAKSKLLSIASAQTMIYIFLMLVLTLEAVFLFIPEAKRGKEAMIELFYMHEHEQEMQKFSALGEVSAKIVHEINNPLSAVIGRVDILLKNKDKNFDDKTIKTFEGMKQGLWRIAKIIKLTKMIYRKGDNDETTVFDLKNVVDDMIETTQLLQNLNAIRFIPSLEEGHFVQAQEHQVFQVISNIVGNAIDATKGLPDAIIYVELVAQDENVVLRISDNGSGVPQGIEDKIFEKLFTTKKTGTGIGLFESRQILQSYGGTLGLNTNISRSCFEIKIPIHH